MAFISLYFTYSLYIFIRFIVSECQTHHYDAARMCLLWMSIYKFMSESNLTPTAVPCWNMKSQSYHEKHAFVRPHLHRKAANRDLALFLWLQPQNRSQVCSDSIKNMLDANNTVYITEHRLTGLKS